MMECNAVDRSSMAKAVGGAWARNCDGGGGFVAHPLRIFVRPSVSRFYIASLTATLSVQKDFN